MDIRRWPPAHAPSNRQTHTHAQVMLYYADLLKVNLITLVLPDQRVFLPVKTQVARKRKKKRGEKHDNKSKSDFMKVAQETADPSEGRRCVDVLPRVVPGEVPGGPSHILHASALRLHVLVTRTERSLGPTALNHTPPPTHCHGPQSRSTQKH